MRETPVVKEVQFVTDVEGHKTAMLLPIEQYEAFQEWLEDLDLGSVARESKNEQTRPFAEVVSEMRAGHEIDV